MTTYPDHILRMGSQHLAELKRKAAEFERQLWDAHESLDYEMTQSSYAPQDDTETGQEAFRWSQDDYEPDGALHAGPVSARPPAGAGLVAGEDTEPAYSPEDRTADLVNHGRHGARRRHRFRGVLMAAVAAAAIAAAITVLVLRLSAPKPAWPASVATVQRQIAVACQNPDVASEPSQVNFACGKGTRQILWVFSLLTSGNNPGFVDQSTGRKGLEPIQPSQGGDIAWSLNLHHPYNAASPVDSLQVAARAINNIISGATLTAASGGALVEPGLESKPANCQRYTGSARLVTRSGYPARCAVPVTPGAGEAALVTDAFQQWMGGTPSRIAQQAGVLFQNADNPGNAQVQAILNSLPASGA